MTVYDTDTAPVEREQKHEDGYSQMQRLADELEAHHTRPAPRARWLEVDPFPLDVMRGLPIGFIAGAIVGAVFGLLLRNYVIVPDGWEGLYSMTPFTFVVFWALIVGAAGMLLVGVGFILAADAPDYDVMHEQKRDEHEEPKRDAVTAASEDSFPASDAPSWAQSDVG